MMKSGVVPPNTCIICKECMGSGERKELWMAITTHEDIESGVIHGQSAKLGEVCLGCEKDVKDGVVWSILLTCAPGDRGGTFTGYPSKHR